MIEREGEGNVCSDNRFLWTLATLSSESLSLENESNVMETALRVCVCGPRSIVEFNANSILTFESMAIADSIKVIPIGNWLISLYLIFAVLQKKKKTQLQHIERTWDVFSSLLFSFSQYFSHPLPMQTIRRNGRTHIFSILNSSQCSTNDVRENKIVLGIKIFASAHNINGKYILRTA